MLIPIGDDNRGVLKTAYVTYSLIALNVVFFFLLQQAGGNEAFTYGWSAIPLEITTGQDLTAPQMIEARGQRVRVPEAPGPTPIYLTLLSSMFMHGGFLHLGGNLLYLWIFGDNVEQRFGSGIFLSFYLLSGLAATLAQIALNPGSVVPTLGASGAISGVLAAYLVLFPRNRVHALFFYFVVSVPALLVIGLWIAFQFVNGFGDFMVSEETTGGVAYGAHVGGFVAGLVMAFVLRLAVKEEPDTALTREARRDDSRRYW